MADVLGRLLMRIENARANFIEIVRERIGCTEEEALRVFYLYKRLRIVELDTGTGRYRVKHGAFFDAATLREAAEDLGAEGDLGRAEITCTRCGEKIHDSRGIRPGWRALLRGAAKRSGWRELEHADTYSGTTWHCPACAGACEGAEEDQKN